MRVIGNEGEMVLTAIRDMPDSLMYILDWSGLTFFGDKFFERKRHMNGDEYFLLRAATGYSYISDIKFYGDLLVHAPAGMGVVHSIPNY